MAGNSGDAGGGGSGTRKAKRRNRVRNDEPMSQTESRLRVRNDEAWRLASTSGERFTVFHSQDASKHPEY
ncbi:unnamed protein product [Urochloa humidicola]